MAPNVSYGSSPLARGLPGGQRQRRLLRGIIPARAGFTRVRHWLIDGARDHPRSRGVYRDGETSNGVGPGSSPLARGLQGDQSSVRENIGIIPARAGFTHVHRRPGRERPDHPRSRGVYTRSSPPWKGTPGSSPLARGLRGERVARCGRRGIIPARAGFTCCRPRAWRFQQDHPRSRGVYPALEPGDEVAVGSSPLARGLLPAVLCARPVRGIIPARAGFTLREYPSWKRQPDHPRSRGVYPVTERTDAGSHGSSPLARGLLADRTASTVSLGIIPARAGFTVTC